MAAVFAAQRGPELAEEEVGDEAVLPTEVESEAARAALRGGEAGRARVVGVGGGYDLRMDG